MIVPVVLSGGSGTRLWPLSRQLYPKQLLPLVSDKTMLQETVERASGLSGDLAPPLVVCNESHRFLVAEQLRALGVSPQAILLEPMGRNTAPAAAVAALVATVEGSANGSDPVLLVLPADHVIRNESALDKAVSIAAKAAREGHLVTFGIVPDKPETGYGYISKADDLGGYHRVERFVEKPDSETAQSYVNSGEYLWNSGMFMFSAKAYLEELGTRAPAMVEACSAALEGAAKDLDFIRLDSPAFESCPKDSIDYAVMEKTSKAVVVPLDAGWSDVGSWAALHDVSEKDADGNTARGDVALEGCRNCFVYASDRLVTAVGLEGHLVIDTKDAVMVTSREHAQGVKQLVERLDREQREQTKLHRQVFRPWGSYDSVDQGERFQVKRLIVNPGAVLSLQMHHHRAEHWVVVSGTAKITRNDEVFLLEENESTYIPVGARHRIENPGMVPLHIIEVQSGSYLGEDDIVRFEDQYGREGTNT